MAKIELIDVSLTYDAPKQDPVDRLLRIEKDRMREDLPAKAGKGVVALDRVNLKIPNGRTFVVVGPSGCGKSTLLRVIAGLNKEYSGKVLYDGQDVQTIEPKDREIGMVFQGYALYPNFNSRGNLSFFFRVNKVPD
jgi:ABC-type sugar transport system ATPase subunit